MKDRGFFDAKSFFKEVREFESELQNTVHSDVTQLYDYDSLVSLRIQRQSPLLYVEDEKREAVASLSLYARMTTGSPVTPSSPACTSTVLPSIRFT